MFRKEHRTYYSKFTQVFKNLSDSIFSRRTAADGWWLKKIPNPFLRLRTHETTPSRWSVGRRGNAWRPRAERLAVSPPPCVAVRPGGEAGDGDAGIAPHRRDSARRPAAARVRGGARRGPPTSQLVAPAHHVVVERKLDRVARRPLNAWTRTDTRRRSRAFFYGEFFRQTVADARPCAWSGDARQNSVVAPADKTTS